MIRRPAGFYPRRDLSGHAGMEQRKADREEGVLEERERIRAAEFAARQTAPTERIEKKDAP